MSDKHDAARKNYIRIELETSIHNSYRSWLDRFTNFAERRLAMLMRFSSGSVDLYQLIKINCYDDSQYDFAKNRVKAFADEIKLNKTGYPCYEAEFLDERTLRGDTLKLLISSNKSYWK